MPQLIRVGGLGRLGGLGGAVSSDPVPVLSLRYGVDVTDVGGFASVWGVASAGVGERPAIITTGGAEGYRGNGTDRRMTLSRLTLAEATGWALMVVFKPNTSHQGDILGSNVAPGTTLIQRIQSDTNSVLLYTSRGLRAPAITGQANNNRRILLIRGDATFWKIWVGGGTGSGAAEPIGDFSVDNLWSRGSTGYFNGELNVVQAWNTLPSLAYLNGVAAAWAADSRFPSAWSTAT